ncbi:MAG: hypothetical protein RR921_08175, partial [Mucinivorans sp.]
DVIDLSYQDVKTITGKPHKFNALKNRVCYDLQQVLDVAQYEGCSPDLKGGKAKGHFAIEQWHYYSFDLNKEKSYITISQKVSGEFKLHSIQDKDHFRMDMIKEKPQ